MNVPQSHSPMAQKTEDPNLGFAALQNALRRFPKMDGITSP